MEMRDVYLELAHDALKPVLGAALEGFQALDPLLESVDFFTLLIGA